MMTTGRLSHTKCRHSFSRGEKVGLGTQEFNVKYKLLMLSLVGSEPKQMTTHAGRKNERREMTASFCRYESEAGNKKLGEGRHYGASFGIYVVRVCFA
jgi:hypothetical protein